MNQSRISLFLVLGWMASLFSAEQSSASSLPEGQIYPYKTTNGNTKEIEVFLPKNHEPAKSSVPGIIMFHGGGWVKGHREQFRYLCHYFSTRGIVAATVSYQFTTKEALKSAASTESPKRICITDAKSAIRWFKQNAKMLGIDPDKIITGGGSAGAHISLLATTTPGLDDPEDPLDYDTSVKGYLLFNPALEVKDKEDPAVDFLQHLHADLPPAIIFYGDQDKWRKKRWQAAKAKMAALDLSESIDLLIAPGQGHGFFNDQPWTDITLIAADKFLHKLGYLEGEPTLQKPETKEHLVSKKLDD